MTEHTPVPWGAGEIASAHIVYGPDGYEIAKCTGRNLDANARFIVTACNCHEKLLEALAEHSLYYLDPAGNELFDQPLNWEAMLLQEVREAEETP